MGEKFWEVKNKAGVAEIIMYGVISNTTWRDDDSTPNLFLDELNKLNGKDVLVRINSPGGDVFAALAIYNMLKSYKGNVDTVADGLVASSAVIILVAGNTVTVSENAMAMIHNPAVQLFGTFSEEEMEKNASYLKKLKPTIINTYLSKCGDKCTEDELSKMMDEETWLTGKECVEKGLADTTTTDEVNISIDNNVLYVNSMGTDIINIPNLDKFKRFIPKTVNVASTKASNNKKGDGKVSFKNLEEMQKEYPEFCNELKSQAAKEVLAKENERVTALNLLRVEGNKTVNSMIDKAKETGRTAEDIKEFVNIAVTYTTPTKPTPEGSTVNDFINQQVKGNFESGVEGVEVTPKGQNTEAEERLKAVNYLANIIK